MILIDIQEQLQQMGYEVVGCLGDAEAAEAIASEPADLLLLNLGLHDERRAGLVATARSRGIRMVITSGTQPTLGDLGGAVFLAKPFSSRDLADAVSRARAD